MLSVADGVDIFNALNSASTFNLTVALKPQRRTRARLSDLARPLIERGMSNGDIANELMTSKSSISSIRAELSRAEILKPESGEGRLEVAAPVIEN